MAAELPGAEAVMPESGKDDERYREIFEVAPVSLWDDDFSGVVTFLDGLRAEGVSDLRAYLAEHPEQLQEAIRRVRVIDVNAATVELFEADRKEDILLARTDLFLPETALHFVGALVALWNGHHRFTGETRLRTFSGRLIDVAFTVVFQGARFERTLVSLWDITARKTTELASNRLAAIVENSGDAILTKDLNGIITSWNHGATELFGYTAEETVGKSVTMLIPRERQDEEPSILARIRAGERIDHYETIRQRKDGTLVDISLSVSPLKDGSGTIIGASKIARDITERKRAQEQESLLVREMNHRIKNLFALASSIISLSARDASDPQDLKTRATERLAALARVHTLTLSRHDAVDVTTATATTLHALISAILAPYAERQGAAPRVTLQGADILLSASATTSFALLVHEFATNAAKYGALSAAAGRVEIETVIAGDRLAVHWTERGGPSVAQPTSIEGFGSYLAKATVKVLGGEITYDWDREGVTVHLDVALARTQA